MLGQNLLGTLWNAVIRLAAQRYLRSVRGDDFADKNELCQVKLISKESPKYNKAALEAEIAVLKSIDHANCMRLYGVYDEPHRTRSQQCILVLRDGHSHANRSRTHSMVLELMGGCTLHERVRNQGRLLSENIGCKIATDILQALRYLHSMQIVHRDIKPANLMFASEDPESSRYNTVVVCDLGLAKQLRDGQRLQSFTGTPGYMAPEILRRDYGREVDIWAVGVTFYTLMCGNAPFRVSRDTPPEQHLAALQQPVELHGKVWEHVSVHCREFIGSCLAIEAHIRLSAAEGVCVSCARVRERVCGRARRYTLNLSATRTGLDHTWLKQARLRRHASSAPCILRHASSAPCMIRREREEREGRRASDGALGAPGVKMRRCVHVVVAIWRMLKLVKRPWAKSALSHGCLAGLNLRQTREAWLERRLAGPRGPRGHVSQHGLRTERRGVAVPEQPVGVHGGGHTDNKNTQNNNTSGELPGRTLSGAVTRRGVHMEGRAVELGGNGGEVGGGHTSTATAAQQRPTRTSIDEQHDRAAGKLTLLPAHSLSLPSLSSLRARFRPKPLAPARHQPLHPPPQQPPPLLQRSSNRLSAYLSKSLSPVRLRRPRQPRDHQRPPAGAEADGRVQPLEGGVTALGPAVMRTESSDWEGKEDEKVDLLADLPDGDDLVLRRVSRASAPADLSYQAPAFPASPASPARSASLASTVLHAPQSLSVAAAAAAVAEAAAEDAAEMLERVCACVCVFVCVCVACVCVCACVRTPTPPHIFVLQGTERPKQELEEASWYSRNGGDERQGLLESSSHGSSFRGSLSSFSGCDA